MTAAQSQWVPERVESLSTAADAPSQEETTHRGQARFAYRLARLHANRLMFVYGLGWYTWDGARWVPDDHGAAKRAVLETLRGALSESLEDKGLRDDVRRSESSAGIAGVLDIASALEPFARTIDDLDADPYLLNVANGTLDLRTLVLRPHDPANRLTKVTKAAYNPDAPGTAWTQFLGVVLPDDDVRGYLQRLIGLSLLGKVVEHIFTIATGTGANGKGTSYNAILYALGDYGHVAESDLFMSAKSNPNGASPAQMGLLGKRLVVVSETERDHKLAVALMKNLTGGDPITARPLYGKPVTFNPSHTSLMVTNYLPKVAGDDPAAWRRLRVIPFDVVIPEDQRDGRLGEQLELECDAILAWAVEGYRQYEKRGMDAPAAVRAATDGYMRDSDAVARFIADCCMVNPHAYASIEDLFARWSKWALEDGAEPLSKRAFGDALTTHGYENTRRGGRSVRPGIGLMADEDAEDEGRSW
jgi:putative DNA primase/helicase